MIRQILLKQRKQMSQEDVRKKSMIIQKKLQHDNWFQNANNILFYVSYGNEVSTHDLIKAKLKNHDQVIVPRSEIKTCSIDLKIITCWDELINGAYGILEPSIDASLFTGQLDLLIIPSVGFDHHGNRLGHGKGYYDRLIQDHPHAKLIGLAYDFQIINAIAIVTHDKKVHKIITEKRCIQI